MPVGWRPTHPGDPTPDWGPGGRTGCTLFITVVIAILVIAALIGATGTAPRAEADVRGGAMFTGAVLLTPMAFDT
jgi:hypothetical protein